MKCKVCKEDTKLNLPWCHTEVLGGIVNNKHLYYCKKELNSKTWNKNYQIVKL